MEAQTPDGEPFEVLAILDGYTLECLSISVERQISLENIIDRSVRSVVLREVPKHIVLGSGSESVSKAVAEWLSHLPVEDRSGRTGQPLGRGRCVAIGDEAEG